MTPKNWIAVASADHVAIGRAAGFMQVGHGKRAPLTRLRPGDRVVYYSPTQQFGVQDALQSFTAIGVVRAGEPYSVDMGGGFVPWRRDVTYAAACPTSIRPLLDALAFVQPRANWGAKFRYGFFAVGDDDLAVIARAMGVDSADPVARSVARLSTMRRADRLFQLVQLVRGRRLSTAEFIAQRLEVSVRTVYRDIADLQRQGVPIEGEAGVGYRMRAGFDLPPLMFTRDEAQALVAAVRIAQPRLDAALAEQAEAALSKILAVLPSAARAAAESLAVYAPDVGIDPATRQRLEQLRLATESRRFVRMDYRDLKGARSERLLRPLGCFYWGAVWTLAAWCETRQDFRSFRIDRIEALAVQNECFHEEAGKTLADLFRRVQMRRPTETRR